jgi:hypothetical protein
MATDHIPTSPLPAARPVSLLQAKLDDRAERELKADVKKMREAVEAMTGQLPFREDMVTIDMRGINGDAYSLNPGVSAGFRAWVIIDALEKHLQTLLLEKYTRKVTDEFIRQVDSVTAIVDERTD